MIDDCSIVNTQVRDIGLKIDGRIGYVLANGSQVGSELISLEHILDHDRLEASCRDCLETGLLIDAGPNDEAPRRR